MQITASMWQCLVTLYVTHFLSINKYRWTGISHARTRANEEITCKRFSGKQQQQNAPEKVLNINFPSQQMFSARASRETFWETMKFINISAAIISSFPTNYALARVSRVFSSICLIIFVLCLSTSRKNSDCSLIEKYVVASGMKYKTATIFVFVICFGLLTEKLAVSESL